MYFMRSKRTVSENPAPRLRGFRWPLLKHKATGASVPGEHGRAGALVDFEPVAVRASATLLAQRLRPLPATPGRVGGARGGLRGRSRVGDRRRGVDAAAATIFGLDTACGSGKTHGPIALLHAAGGMQGVPNAGEASTRIRPTAGMRARASRPTRLGARSPTPVPEAPATSASSTAYQALWREHPDACGGCLTGELALRKLRLHFFKQRPRSSQQPPRATDRLAPCSPRTPQGCAVGGPSPTRATAPAADATYGPAPETP